MITMMRISGWHCIMAYFAYILADKNEDARLKLMPCLTDPKQLQCCANCTFEGHTH